MTARYTVNVFILALAMHFSTTAQGQAVPKPNPNIAMGSWAPKKGEHPRLFGPKEYLKNRAEQKPDLFARVEGHNSIRAHGIVHAVKGLDESTIQEHISEAMENVGRGKTNVHQDSWIWMLQVVHTYDLFHDKISKEQKAKMIEWLNLQLESFTTDENAFHNSTLSKINTYLRVAYATSGENPRAKDFRDYAILKLYEGKVVPVLRQFGDGGGFVECGWYTRSSLWHLVQGLELARRMEKYDGFQKANKFFYQRLAYEILQPYPISSSFGSHMYAMEGDGSNIYGGHYEYPRLTRMVLSQYWRGSELAKYVANWNRPATSSEVRVDDFLWEEEPDEKLDMAEFPMAHLAKGIGRLYARGGWGEDATWLRFECGDWFSNHQHLEVGNFEIVRYKPLATESGEYTNFTDSHAVNWLMRTVAHNCILVEWSEEKWSGLRDHGSNRYYNDGGQQVKWKGVADDIQGWAKRSKEFERGNIVAYENQPEFMYVAGDCSAAYHPDKLRGWLRQIVFVRPHTIVIMDRVVKTKLAGNSAWLLHSTNEPKIDGNLVEIEDGEGKLHVLTLLPEKINTRAIEGYSYGGNEFPAEESSLTKAAAKWRMEVIPAERKDDEIFLHVLSTDGKPEATLLEGRDAGVKIGDVELKFNSSVGGTLTIKDKKFPLKSTVKTGKYE